MSKEYTRPVTILGQLPIAGTVLFVDDFEELLNWTKVDGVGDAIFELDPTIAKQGRQSLHMKTRTTGAAQADKIRANRYIHLLPSKIMSFVSTFSSPNFTPIDYLTFDFFWYDGTNLNRGYIKFKPNTPSWSYADSGDVLRPITGLDVLLSTNCFHTVIIKINFTTLKYYSLQVDHLFADLSAYALKVDTNPNPSTLQTQIVLATAGAAPCETYLDQIAMHEL